MKLNLTGAGCLAIMRSHSVTFHPTQVTTPPLTPTGLTGGRYSLYLPTPEGWKAELTSRERHLVTTSSVSATVAYCLCWI